MNDNLNNQMNAYKNADSSQCLSEEAKNRIKAMDHKSNHMMKKSFIAVFCCSIIFGITISAVAFNIPKWFQPKDNDVYIFPQTEGEVQDYLSSVDFYQIPENVLKNISTEGLLTTCLDYPLFAINMITSDSSYYDGFIKTKNQFNGLQEFYNRTDCGKAALDLYKSVDVKTVVEGGSTEYIFRFTYLEYILTQEELTDRLSNKEKEELIAAATAIFEESREKYPDRFSIYLPLLLITRTAYSCNDTFREYADSNNNIAFFLKNGFFEELTTEDINKIIELT